MTWKKVLKCINIVLFAPLLIHGNMEASTWKIKISVLRCESECNVECRIAGLQ
jgi:hypothetical protein